MPTSDIDACNEQGWMIAYLRALKLQKAVHQWQISAIHQSSVVFCICPQTDAEVAYVHAKIWALILQMDVYRSLSIQMLICFNIDIDAGVCHCSRVCTSTRACTYTVLGSVRTLASLKTCQHTPSLKTVQHDPMQGMSHMDKTNKN